MFKMMQWTGCPSFITTTELPWTHNRCLGGSYENPRMPVTPNIRQNPVEIGRFLEKKTGRSCDCPDCDCWKLKLTSSYANSNYYTKVFSLNAAVIWCIKVT
jgi:hypothetical protein